jgi:chloramphenicol O-acetyltransferase type B
MTLLGRMRAAWRRRGARGGARMLAAAYPQYDVGRGSYGGLTVITFGESTTLRMGAFCSVSSGVEVLLGGGHRADWVTTYPFSALDPAFADIQGHPQSRGDIIIGNDVWIGRKATILSGVTIGDGAIIGAHAVVARDVPPYAVVAGNPGRLVRQRFDPPTIERLLAIAWWDWDDARIARAMHYMLDTDIGRFLDAAEQDLF